MLALPLVIVSNELPPTKKINYQCDKLEAYLEYDHEYTVTIDCGGGGIAMVSEMESRGYKVIGVNNGGVSDLPNTYENMASQLWFQLAEKVTRMACPKVPRLETELVNRKQVPLTVRGKQKIESKRDYIGIGKRAGSEVRVSPDFADALTLLVYEPPPCDVFVQESSVDFYA